MMGWKEEKDIYLVFAFVSVLDADPRIVSCGIAETKNNVLL
jgi:hypothetical protein